MNWIAKFRKKKKEKKEAVEFSKMLSSIQRMYGVELDEQYLSSHIRRATEQEVAHLISVTSPQEVERKHTGYYNPPIDKFIKLSLERRPDWVFYLNRLELFEDDSVDMTLLLNIHRIRPQEFLLKNYYVFEYNSFGDPDTHLGARRGYVLFDPELNDIVATNFLYLS